MSLIVFDLCADFVLSVFTRECNRKGRREDAKHAKKYGFRFLSTLWACLAHFASSHQSVTAKVAKEAHQPATRSGGESAKKNDLRLPAGLPRCVCVLCD
jgi:hypothetical protein